MLRDRLMGSKAVPIIFVIGLISFLSLIGYEAFYLKYRSDETIFEKPAISKSEAKKIAREFTHDLGFDAKNYPHTTISYSSRNQSILYLLKKIGYKGTKQLIEEKDIPYAYWSVGYGGVRREYIDLDIDARTGKIINYSFYRPVSPAEKINNLSEGKARILAEKFLLARGVNLAGLSFLNFNKNTANIQDEYYFKWKKNETDLAGAEYIINLAVKADKVADYSLSLDLPEDFKYTYENKDFISQFWFKLAGGFSFLLVLILVIVAIIRRKAIDWRSAKAWAVILAVVFFTDSLNKQTSYAFYIDMTYKLISAAFFSLMVFVLVAVVRLIFRENFGFEAFRFRREEKTNIISSLLICYSLTFFSLILVSAVYELLDFFKLGWSVGPGAVVNEILTSRVIYLAPFLVGLIPAFAEEFFRAFTMAFSKKLFKYTLAAVLISAFLWGLMHIPSDGSYYPGYLVGFEKFLNGIIIGYIVIYLGLEVAILWHFLNNFFATNSLLFYLGPDYSIFATLMTLAVIAPFFISAYLYFKKPIAHINQ